MVDELSSSFGGLRAARVGTACPQVRRLPRKSLNMEQHDIERGVADLGAGTNPGITISACRST